MLPSRISFNTTSGKQPGSACLLQDLVISRPARRTPMPMLLDELRVGQSLASMTPTVDPPTQQSQSMTFPALPVQSYGDSDFALTATASSNLSVSYVSGNTGVATVSGNTVHIVAPGTTSITANQSENSEYLLAPDASQTLTVNKASQSIIFSAFGAKTFGDANHTLSGSTNSGLVDVTRSPNMNNKCFPSSQSRRLKSLFSGFTLIELLVVIAIIGVLAAIALPIFGAVQKRAQNVQDISNMRQLALLASQYSTENNGAFVPGKGYDDPVTKTGTQQWQVLLARLYVPKNIAGIWELPDFTTTPAKLKKEYAIFSPPWHKLTDKFWQTGYGINMDIGLPENTKTNTAESWGQIYSAINVTELTKRPLIFSWPEWNAYSSYSLATFKQALGPTKKINILFCDYHVGTIDEKDEAKFKAMIKNPASI